MNSSLVISTGCKKQQTKQCRFNTMKVIFTCLRFAYIWNSGFLTCKTQNILMLVFCRGSELPIWWLKAEALIVSCTFRIVSRQFKVSSLVIRPFKTGNRSPLVSSGNLLLLVNFPRNYHVIRSLFENVFSRVPQARGKVKIHNNQIMLLCPRESFWNMTLFSSFTILSLVGRTETAKFL